MTPEDALAQSTALLDEATENLTFDAFDWAFEEAWCGVAWALAALQTPPPVTLGLSARGAPRRADALSTTLAATPNPPREAARLVARFEALWARVASASHLTQEAWAEHADAVVALVFDAWTLHDACSQRVGLIDDRLGDRLMLADVSPGRVGSKALHRRDALKLLLAGSVIPLHACAKVDRDNRPSATPTPPGAAKRAAPAPAPPAKLAGVEPLGGSLWKTRDPFLFCAYHLDDYPEGNPQLGPAASLEGRQLGRDFAGKDNWRMYHGRTVPGFPRHPHRGFETVTVVRTGLLDHSDSLGATARYGGGDVQWLTAGRGLQHAEMFPLLQQDAPNPLELYQIWLNLPAEDKMVDPHFTMLWNEHIPRVVERDAAGKLTEITVAAGRLRDHAPPSPPPNSWASRPAAQVAIWTLKMEPGAQVTLPEVAPGTLRTLYLHEGKGARIAGQAVADQQRVLVDDHGPLTIQAGAAMTELLLLQGKPIGEPVAKRGPFVMNTQAEIRQAYADYRKTQFGGWPWGDGGPVHARTKGRFARHINGTFEEPT